MCKEECWKRWRAVADLLDRPELIQDLVVRDGSSLEAGDVVLRAVDDLDPLYGKNGKADTVCRRGVGLDYDEITDMFYSVV